jgi:hypothetical protein
MLMSRSRARRCSTLYKTRLTKAARQVRIHALGVKHQLHRQTLLRVGHNTVRTGQERLFAVVTVSGFGSRRAPRDLYHGRVRRWSF